MNQPMQPGQPGQPPQYPPMPGQPGQPYPPNMQGQPYPPYPPYPPQKQGMSGGKIALIIVGVVFAVLFLGGLLVGVLAVATVPKINAAKNKLELKQLGDLETGLRNIAVDNAKKMSLKNPTLADASGRDFYERAFKKKLLDDGLVNKICSLNSSDSPADKSFIDGGGSLPSTSCSYTAPRGGELLSLMIRKGSKRTVLITFNSRNWNNYANDGVPVVWSDGETPVFMTFDEAQRDWGITRAEWDDPAGKLFGKKAPFDHTYE
ncbi:MAG: hypothetical protein IT464_13680 [Planctomycetes bacterium]|nr:hypothetical protein [Planctomycetota bacterium]